jgi:hypothetical protein
MTPQEDKDIIPQEFKDWVRQTCPNWAGDGQSAIWKDGAYTTYRHLFAVSKPETRLRWVNYPANKPNIGIRVLIQYDQGTQRELGDRLLLKELYENGWEDVQYLDESIPSSEPAKEIHLCPSCKKPWDISKDDICECGTMHSDGMYLAPAPLDKYPQQPPQSSSPNYEKITSLKGVVEWIEKDMAEHTVTFPDGKNVFVNGAMTALKNLKYFIDLSAQSEPVKESQPSDWIKGKINQVQQWMKAYVSENDIELNATEAMGHLYAYIFNLFLNVAPHPEPSEQSQQAFLEWLDGESDTLQLTKLGDPNSICRSKVIAFIATAREKYLSIHAQPKGEVDVNDKK